MYRSFLSVRYFRTRLVNWLSVAGVMVGVAVMIVVWSVFSGFQVEVRKAIRGTLADIELSPRGNVIPPAYSTLEPILAAAPDVVASVPRLTSYVAHPWPTPRSDGGTGEAFHFLMAVGVDWKREVAALAAAKRRGARDATGLPNFVLASDDGDRPFFSRTGFEKWKRESDYTTAMFSLSFLRHFLARGEPRPAKDFLGQIVGLVLIREAEDAEGAIDYKRSTLRVYVGSVYDGHDQETDIRRVFFDRAVLWELTKPIRPRGSSPPVAEEVPYTELGVSIVDFETADASRKRIAAHLEGRGVPPFHISTWQDQRAPLLKAVSSERALLAIVIGFIGLLAGFTILATLTLTVVEKTRDIGVLRALGATAQGVMAVFLFSGVLIGVLGGVLGVGLGIVLTESLEPFRGWLKSTFDVDLFPADIYLFDKIPYVYDRAAILWIAGGCMVMAFLASLLPSLRASRMDPVVALRHE